MILLPPPPPYLLSAGIIAVSHHTEPSLHFLLCHTNSQFSLFLSTLMSTQLAPQHRAMVFSCPVSTSGSCISIPFLPPVALSYVNVSPSLIQQKLSAASRPGRMRVASTWENTVNTSENTPGPQCQGECNCKAPGVCDANLVCR